MILIRMMAFVVLFAALPQVVFAEEAKQPWYEGGTLQKSTVAAWQKASPADQLATSADFLAALRGIRDVGLIEDKARLEDFKKNAMDLQECINKTIAEGKSVPSRPIAEITILCTVMKEK